MADFLDYANFCAIWFKVLKHLLFVFDDWEWLVYYPLTSFIFLRRSLRKTLLSNNSQTFRNFYIFIIFFPPPKLARMRLILLPKQSKTFLISLIPQIILALHRRHYFLPFPWPLQCCLRVSGWSYLRSIQSLYRMGSGQGCCFQSVLWVQIERHFVVILAGMEV